MKRAAANVWICPPSRLDLCKALDGKPISTNDRDGYATFKLAERLQSSLCRKGWRSTEIDKVAVHIDPPDELDRLRGYEYLSIEYRLPASVTVSGQAVARQDRRRHRGAANHPAQAPLANLREFARQLERDGRPLELIGRAYAAQFPELEITVPELSDHRGSIRGSAPIHLLADFYSDGCVSIERMELTRAQFERVIWAARRRMKVEARKRSHRRAGSSNREAVVCQGGGINVAFTSVGDIDAWQWKRVGLRMDDTSGKFALVMLRTKQVRVHHKRTKHEYVFRISDDRIEVAECLLHPNHAAPVDPRDFREEALAAAEWFIEKRSRVSTDVLDVQPRSGWVAA